MIELLDIPFSLDAEALKQELRVRPGTGDETAFTELFEKAVEVGRPKAVYEVAYIEEKTDDGVLLQGGVRFTSRALRRNLDNVERVFAHVATCGTEVNALTVPEGDVLQGYWLWTIREKILDAAIKHLYDHLAGSYRLTGWAVMEPGSGDAGVWPIEQQTELFSFLGDVESAIGVRLLPSLLMVPEMSVSGILFPTETGYASCQVCHREDCRLRKAPFDEEIYRAVCAD